MTPERAAALVAAWVRLYTRDVTADVAERRRAEIDADLHDHIAHDRAQGAPGWRIALSIVARMVRGLPADAAWRRTTTRKDLMKPIHRSVIRVALVTALVLLVPLVTTLAGDGEGWSVADFVLGGALLLGTGALLELAVRNPRAIGFRIAAGLIGVAAMVLGEADDAPGLVLFGCVLIAGTLAVSARTALRDGS
jgi:hypothetical protein